MTRGKGLAREFRPELEVPSTGLLSRIVLFDLDGTVITFDGPPPGPGRTALERAMRELYSLERATDGLRVAGGTDRALARALLARAGVAVDAAAIDRVLESYVRHLQDVVTTRRYHAIGEVARTVDALRAHGAVVGVATGNVREGARIKLASAGLEETFDLEYGGFGCDAELRADILRMAVERCSQRAPGEVIVVGDTERDVLAGRAVGARVVGIATDDEARTELHAAGADAIVAACGDELLAHVLG